MNIKIRFPAPTVYLGGWGEAWRVGNSLRGRHLFSDEKTKLVPVSVSTIPVCSKQKN
jgi:hypothetical protein